VLKKNQNSFSAGKKKSLNLKVEEGHLTSKKFSPTKLAICLISILFISTSKENSLKIASGSAV